MHPQELGAAHPLHCSTLDGQWGVLGVTSLEADNNILGLADVSQEVVVFAPSGQKLHLLPLVGLVTVGDEAHQCCVICKLHKVVGAVGWCAVMCQQGEEEGADHIDLWGPCAQGDVA